MAMIGFFALAWTCKDLAKILESKDFSSSFTSSAAYDTSVVNLGNDRFAIVEAGGIQVFEVDKAGRLKRLDDVNYGRQELVPSHRTPVRNKLNVLPRATRSDSAAGVNSGHGNH
jgi:hypothetical protein